MFQRIIVTLFCYMFFYLEIFKLAENNDLTTSIKVIDNVIKR